jgi:hypothetical protein
VDIVPIRHAMRVKDEDWVEMSSDGEYANDNSGFYSNIMAANSLKNPMTRNQDTYLRHISKHMFVIFCLPQNTSSIPLTLAKAWGLTDSVPKLVNNIAIVCAADVDTTTSLPNPPPLLQSLL